MPISDKIQSVPVKSARYTVPSATSVPLPGNPSKGEVTVKYISSFPSRPISANSRKCESATPLVETVFETNHDGTLQVFHESKERTDNVPEPWLTVAKNLSPEELPNPQSRKRNSEEAEISTGRRSSPKAYALAEPETAPGIHQTMTAPDENGDLQNPCMREF